MNTPSLAAGATFANDFRIVHRLGAGGMGSVYVASQLSTGKQRALKLMLPALVADEGLRRRFEQEARIGALIESDHVVEVVAAGVDEASGLPWLAMELLKGEDLAAVVSKQGASPVSAVQNILRQLCHAVGAAHAAGIIHRDLKPENVFLAESKRAGETSVVKVLDFGIAKIAAEASTKHTSAVGSPIWMAPEQTERGVITPAADVWAVGLLAFYLLTGRYFWIAADSDESTIHQIMREVLFDPIPNAHARAEHYGVEGTLPPWFDAWFACCVVRDLSKRFQSATAAYAAFDEHCAVTVSGVSSTTPLAPASFLAPAQPALSAAPLEARSSSLPPVSGASAAGTRGMTEIGAPVGSIGAPPHQRVVPRSSRHAVFPLLGLVAIGAVVAGGWAITRSRQAAAAHLVQSSASGAPETASSDPAPSEASIHPAPPLAVASATHKTAGGHSTPSGALSAAIAREVGSSEPSQRPPDGQFDRAAAVIALSAIETQSCAQPDGPRGPGRVFVTFQPDGTASRVAFDERGATRYVGTPVGQCLTRRFAVKVAPFIGNPATVGRPFTIN